MGFMDKLKKTQNIAVAKKKTIKKKVVKKAPVKKKLTPKKNIKKKVVKKALVKKKPTPKKNIKKTVAKKISKSIKKTSIKRSVKKKSSKPKKKSTTNKSKKNTKSKKQTKKTTNSPKKGKRIPTEKKVTSKIIDEYTFDSDNMPIQIRIFKKSDEYVPIYDVSISNISKTTEMILEQIRRKLIREVSLGMVDITNLKQTGVVEDKFKETISILIEKYFPDIDEKSKGYLTTYLIQKSLGLGNIEILMHDKLLEEITINQADDPVWIYHKNHGWLKTNIILPDEDKTKHYSAMIARKVGRQISVLEPLLDAHLDEGDRVNATLMPISSHGNTITIRKFSRDPFTITHFLRTNTMSVEAAAIIWLAMQYEMSALIAGGTASGKTSTLNALASFFPPNQRIISIEDTRELRLPKFLHWVPMSTRQANSEGKGEVTMEHLLVNSLRQRPDRILVGEVRRQREAETLFEAIHTGHSCYATFHANNSVEAVDRLTNPPISVPKSMLPAISLVIVQFRNRRTGKRRTFQIAEIMPDATVNMLMQYDAKNDKLKPVNKSKVLMKTLELYTGHNVKELNKILKIKQSILNYMVKNNIDQVDSVGRIMAEYYTNYDNLIKHVRANKILR
jgi:archaeal flagellar protein FlaI